MKQLRILFAEDSEDDVILLVRQLKEEGYETVWQRVETPETMAAALKAEPWDIVISDHSMPKLSSTQVLATLRASDSDIPAIIVSGTIGEQTAVEAMRAGARDFFVKGHLARLAPVIDRELKEAEERRKARRIEEQLFQVQKIESIGRLAGGVAHDFNNLLTAILGLADLSIRELPPESPIKADLQEIKNVAFRAAALTQQLLAFSRRQIIQPKVVDLNAVVTNLQRMLRRLIEESVHIELRAAKEPATTLADPTQLEQLVINLAVNARDAMPKGGTLTISVSEARLDDAFVSVHPGAAAGEYVRLTVRDTGVGFSPEARKHLFEPFFTTKELGKGTGLGLATCYGIVKQNGGYLAVESALGKGTAFDAYLPKTEGRPEPAKGETPRSPSLRGRETVLVAEDEAAVRRLACRILRSYGYDVLEAVDGRQALHMLLADTDKRVRLVLTDTIMPHLGGKELVDELRRRRPDVKAIYTSGYTDDSLANQGVLQPGVDFIAKPFEPEELARRVRQALDRT